MTIEMYGRVQSPSGSVKCIKPVVMHFSFALIPTQVKYSVRIFACTFVGLFACKHAGLVVCWLIRACNKRCACAHTIESRQWRSKRRKFYYKSEKLERIRENKR